MDTMSVMEGNVGVRLPSGPQSLGEDQSGTSQDPSGSTVVAKKSLVTGFTRVEHGAAQGAPALGKTAEATQVSCIPQEYAGSPGSRLEAITKGIRSDRFLKDVIERVARGKL